MSPPQETTPLVLLEVETLAREVKRQIDAGQALDAWWRSLQPEPRAALRSFELIPPFRDSGEAWGFRQTVDVPDLGLIRLMGSHQRLSFYHPKFSVEHPNPGADAILPQVRQLANEYFLRNLRFTLPQAYPQLGNPALPPYLELFSWYSRRGERAWGANLNQLYFETVDGRLGSFPVQDQTKIVPLDSLGKTYAWVVIATSLRDISWTLSLAGSRAPSIVMPRRRRVLLILSPRLKTPEVDDDGTEAILGPVYSILEVDAQGSKRLSPAIEYQNFRVMEDGAIWFEATFLCHQPDRTTSALETAGVTDTIDDVLESLGNLDLRHCFDARGVTTDDCGTRDRALLLTRCIDQYRGALGILHLWQQTPDWLDGPALPQWVSDGVLKEGLS